MTRSNGFSEEEDRAKTGKSYCGKLKYSVWFCEECDDNINLHADRSGASRHKRQCHSLKNQPTKELVSDEFDEREVELMSDAFFNDIPKEVSDFTFTDGRSKEVSSLCELTNNLHEGAVGNSFLIDDTLFASAIWFVLWGCN